ncbi:MAG: cytochrome c3 family protein [Chloroflexi bacterium]|nr:cytochrome c3 family protein [Chloroflexota bacterium]
MRSREAWRLLIGTLLALALLSIATATVQAQGPSGAPHPPPASGGATSCWQCHRQPNLQATAGIAAANALCEDCHAKPDTVAQVNGQEISLQVQKQAFGKSRHALVACTACHTSVARSPHREIEPVACDGCHSNLAQHLAIGDPHLNVDCAACHFQNDHVALDSTTSRVVLARVDSQGKPVSLTDHTLVSQVPCGRCHTRGNAVLAPAAALPPKDITCIGCHPSVPIAASPLSWGAMGIFLIGLVLNVSVWLGGSVAGKLGLSLGEKMSLLAEQAVAIVFSRRLFTLGRAALLDGILHRRLLKENVARWVAHSLILLPFAARFALGLVTGLAAQFYPGAPLTRVLVDRDAPPVAFTNDLLALLIVLGAGYAGYLRATDKQRRALTAGQDALALLLLALIFVFGFLVEGVHILTIQLPWNQAAYAFVGAALAALLNPLPLDWGTIYPALFYVHAILVATFVAYLPFSKFFHILVSLFVVAVRPALEDKSRSGHPAGAHVP